MSKQIEQWLAERREVCTPPFNSGIIDSLFLDALDVIERLRVMVSHDHLCDSRFCVPHLSEEIGRPCSCTRDQRLAQAFGIKEEQKKCD